MLFRSNDDRAQSPEQVDQHEAELKKHRKDYEFHRYDGAGHGIFYYHRPMYRVEQALESGDRCGALGAGLDVAPERRGSLFVEVALGEELHHRSADVVWCTCHLESSAGERRRRSREPAPVPCRT